MDSSLFNGFHKANFRNLCDSSDEPFEYIGPHNVYRKYSFESSSKYENNAQEHSELRNNDVNEEIDIKMEIEQDNEDSNSEQGFIDIESSEYCDENEEQVIHVFTVDPELELDYSSDDEDTQGIFHCNEGNQSWVGYQVTESPKTNSCRNDIKLSANGSNYSNESVHKSTDLNEKENANYSNESVHKSADLNEKENILLCKEETDSDDHKAYVDNYSTESFEYFPFDKYLIDSCSLSQPRKQSKSFSLPHSPSQNCVQDDQTNLSFEEANLNSFIMSADCSENQMETVIERNVDSFPSHDFSFNEEEHCDDFNELDMEIEKPIQSQFISVNTPTESPIPDKILDFCIQKKHCYKNDEPSNIRIKVEDDFVDVVSINELTPILKAPNLTALLEQFEASEQVNSIQDGSKAEEIVEDVDGKANILPIVNAPRQQVAAKHLNNLRIKNMLISPPSSNNSVRYNSSQESVHSDHDYCSSNNANTWEIKTKKIYKKRQCPLKSDLYLEDNDKISRPRSCKRKNIDYSISSDDEINCQKDRRKAQFNNKKINKIKDKGTNLVIENTQCVKSKSQVLKNAKEIQTDNIHLTYLNCNDVQNGSLKVIIKNRSKVRTDKCEYRPGHILEGKTMPKIINSLEVDRKLTELIPKNSDNKSSLENNPSPFVTKGLPYQTRTNIICSTDLKSVNLFDPIAEASKKISRLLNSKKLKAEAIRKKEEELIQRNIPKMEHFELKPLITDEQMMQLTGLTPESLSPMISPGKNNKEFEEIVLLSIGINTDSIDKIQCADDNTNANKINFKIKKVESVISNNVFGEKSNKISKADDAVDPQNMNRYENIAATLKTVKQNYDGKISSNSLFASIQKVVKKATDQPEKQNETLSTFTNSDGETNPPKIGRKIRTTIIRENNNLNDHGEDKVILHLNKNRIRPEVKSIQTQTDIIADLSITSIKKPGNSPTKVCASSNKNQSVKEYSNCATKYKSSKAQDNICKSKKQSRFKEISSSRRKSCSRDRQRRRSISRNINYSRNRSRSCERYSRRSRSRNRRSKSRNHRSRSRSRRSRSRNRRSKSRSRRSISRSRRSRSRSRRSRSRSRRSRSRSRRSRSRSRHSRSRSHRSKSQSRRKRRTKSPHYGKKARTSRRRSYRSRSSDRKRGPSIGRDSKRKRAIVKKIIPPSVETNITLEKPKQAIEENTINSTPDISPRQKTSSESSETSTSSNTSSDSVKTSSPSRTPTCSPRRHRSQSIDSDLTPVEERRIVFVGKLAPDTTKHSLRSLFTQFGPITDVRLHIKENGGRFGFVTFAKADDAWRAVGAGDTAANGFSVGFGGRRAFCRQNYADLDGLEAEYSEYMTPPLPLQRNEGDQSFDRLLQDMKRQLDRKKKCGDAGDAKSDA